MTVHPRQPARAARARATSRVALAIAAAAVAVVGFTPSAWAGGALTSIPSLPPGRTWTAPVPYAPHPGHFSGVSCFSTSCTAVGDTISPPKFASQPTVMSWTGTAWRKQRIATLSSQFQHLTAISCGSSKSCWAVGTSDSSSDVLEKMNGNAWSRAGSPSDAASTTFEGISCPTALTCMIFGEDSATGDTAAPHAELWKGKRWLSTQVPEPKSAQYTIGVNGFLRLVDLLPDDEQLCL